MAQEVHIANLCSLLWDTKVVKNQIFLLPVCITALCKKLIHLWALLVLKVKNNL